MNRPVARRSGRSDKKWGKWILLVVLLMVAAAMYAAIIVKTVKYGL